MGWRTRRSISVTEARQQARIDSVPMTTQRIVSGQRYRELRENDNRVDYRNKDEAPRCRNSPAISLRQTSDGYAKRLI